MKVLHVKTLKDNRRHALIELKLGEELPVAPLQATGFYKLDYPMDDTIIEGYMMKDPQRVHWDSYSQKWVDV